MGHDIVCQHRRKDAAIRKDIHNSDLPLICRACESRHNGVCGALSPEQLLRLSKHTAKTAHQPNTDLTKEASSSQRYANILSGVVKLTKISRDGRQQIVGLQFAPDFMGRPFADSTDVEAVASTNVRLCSFPVSVLEEMLDESPSMERRIYRQTMAELDEARDWLFALGRKSAREKVAGFVFLIATHANPELIGATSVDVELPLKRADIADFLGLTIETVSRQITHLRKAGVIDVIDRNRVHVPDLEALRHAASVE